MSKYFRGVEILPRDFVVRKPERKGQIEHSKQAMEETCVDERGRGFRMVEGGHYQFPYYHKQIFDSKNS